MTVVLISADNVGGTLGNNGDGSTWNDVDESVTVAQALLDSSGAASGWTFHYTTVPIFVTGSGPNSIVGIGKAAWADDTEVLNGGHSSNHAVNYTIAEFGGLNPAKKYNIYVIGTATSAGRTTEFMVNGGTAQEFDNNNGSGPVGSTIDDDAKFLNVSPDVGGIITFQFRNGANSSGTGYFNVARIEEVTPNLTLNEPLVSGTTVTATAHNYPTLGNSRFDAFLAECYLGIQEPGESDQIFYGDWLLNHEDLYPHFYFNADGNMVFYHARDGVETARTELRHLHPDVGIPGYPNEFRSSESNTMSGIVKLLPTALGEYTFGQIHRKDVATTSPPLRLVVYADRTDVDTTNYLDYVWAIIRREGDDIWETYPLFARPTGFFEYRLSVISNTLTIEFNGTTVYTEDVGAVTGNEWTSFNLYFKAGLYLTGSSYQNGNVTVEYKDLGTPGFKAKEVSIEVVDSQANSISLPLTHSVAEDYTFVVPDLPTSGVASSLLFGDVTVTLNDPG